MEEDRIECVTTSIPERLYEAEVNCPQNHIQNHNHSSKSIRKVSSTLISSANTVVEIFECPVYANFMYPNSSDKEERERERRQLHYCCSNPMSSSSSLTSGCHTIGWSSSSLFPRHGFFPNSIFKRSFSSKFKLNCSKFPQACSANSDPLLVKAARGQPVSRPPAWMMREAGRYMAAYRKLAEKHPSFRERSETTDLIVEISLQPWEAYRPDGVIIFSDILTPLPAFGVPFDIEEVRGPDIQSPIQNEDALKALHPIDLEKLDFVGESLKILRHEVTFAFHMLSVSMC